MASLVSGDDSGPEKLLALGAERIPVAKRAIESENAAAALGACQALAQVDDPAATAVLITALSSNAPEVRIAALDAIGAKRRTDARAAVVGRFADADAGVRAAACDVLARLEQASTALEKLFALLSDSDDAVRVTCGLALAAATKDLPSKSSETGEQLARGGWQDRVGALLLETQSAKKLAALRILSAWRGPVAYDLIRGRLSDPDLEVKGAAIAALAPFGSLDVLREITPYLNDGDAGVRLEAVAALGSLPIADTRSAVLAAATDADPRIRAESATQLIRAPDEPETPLRLGAMLRDEDPQVRFAAAFSIARLARQDAFEMVRSRLAIETDEAVRLELLDALVACGYREALGPLVEVLETAQGPVRLRALIHLRTRTKEDAGSSPKLWREWLEKRARPVTP